MATLKALRRSAARYLTVGGMPLDILRQYLRHNSVATTMGYLRLTVATARMRCADGWPKGVRCKARGLPCETHPRGG